VQSFTIETTTHGRYLVRSPARLDAPAPLVVGFHGYSENADAHMQELSRIPGSEAWLLVAVQGLHRFYARAEAIAASWMTRQDRELAIADNVAYVDRVVAAVRRAHPSAGGLALLGFSQGASMAFRMAALGAERPRAIVTLAGDVPPEIRSATAASFPRALVARGERDTWYTAARSDADVAFLRSVGTLVEPLTFDGGHEWNDAFRSAAGEFLARTLAGG